MEVDRATLLSYPACHSERSEESAFAIRSIAPPVILSAAKNLICHTEILSAAKNDRHEGEWFCHMLVQYTHALDTLRIGFHEVAGALHAATGADAPEEMVHPAPFSQQL